MIKDAYTLYELNSMARTAIETCLPDEYWVEAELSECRERNGHCYMELVQKDGQGNTPIAKAQAKCWRQTWTLVSRNFAYATGQQMRSGMKVLLRVRAQFHESFGFSWIVTDIDPTYTIGDIARRRREIIMRLKEMGVFDLNKQIPLPLFTQRIAVISSDSAAGYGDFCNQLLNNQYGFRFDITLFPAIMQGEQVEKSIIRALDCINNLAGDYDCVVIIRGGGATSDLSGFDTLALAENVANFPLPVITGIGHERDECVLDMIAHTRVKTPTAAAAFLIEHLLQVSERLERLLQRMAVCTQNKLKSEQARLQHLGRYLPTLFATMRVRHEMRLDKFAQRMTSALARNIEKRRHTLQMLQQRATMQDPQRILQRGYSITMCNGKVVRNANEANQGDEITTRLENGTIISIVK